jgi:hypothetical protein
VAIMENELILPTELNCGYYDSRTFFTSKTSPKRISATFEIEYFLEDGKNTYSDGETFPIRKNQKMIKEKAIRMKIDNWRKE